MQGDAALKATFKSVGQELSRIMDDLCTNYGSCTNYNGILWEFLQDLKSLNPPLFVNIPSLFLKAVLIPA